MRNSETVLGMLQDRGKRGVPVNDLYRQLYNPHLYLRAYAKLYANTGAMTKGSTQETADGMSLDKISQIIEVIKQGKFHWTPVRRTYIKKKNGKLRPLGLPTWTDKLVQEVIRSLLEAYYEPQFSSASHGFRPQRGCHTALSLVQQTWTGASWFIEGDIKACFDSLDHMVMRDILAKKIHDNRFLRLIEHLLQAGYLEEWHYHTTHSGSPQGGVCSPILANIYLNQLDQFIETDLIPRFTQGTLRKPNPDYHQLKSRMEYRRKTGRYQEAKALKRRMRIFPSCDPNDPHYRRLRYVRYADDTLLGFIGPKSEAEEIKEQIRIFLQDHLKLELSLEKTLITHATTKAARFLNYEIIVCQKNDLLVGKGREKQRMGKSVRLRVPLDVLHQKRARYKKHQKPLRRLVLASQPDSTIFNTYQLEYRGIYQYYQLADNVGWLTELHWDMAQSLLFTLAAKYRSTKKKMVDRYRSTTETESGPRSCLKATMERPGGKTLIAIFGGIALKRRTKAVLIDRVPTPIQYERKEVIRRLIRGRCELCEAKDDRCVVHQVKKLSQLKDMGKEKPQWAHIMLKRRRKTLIVCQACHTTLHQDE
jgi:group II intron reverse transcriptase/maturase